MHKIDNQSDFAMLMLRFQHYAPWERKLSNKIAISPGRHCPCPPPLSAGLLNIFQCRTPAKFVAVQLSTVKHFFFKYSAKLKYMASIRNLVEIWIPNAVPASQNLLRKRNHLFARDAFLSTFPLNDDQRTLNCRLTAASHKLRIFEELVAVLNGPQGGREGNTEAEPNKTGIQKSFSYT